jgi:hypothetical protein
MTRWMVAYEMSGRIVTITLTRPHARDRQDAAPCECNPAPPLPDRADPRCTLASAARPRVSNRPSPTRTRQSNEETQQANP